MSRYLYPDPNERIGLLELVDFWVTVLLGITPTILTLISLANTDIPSTQLGLVLIMSTIRILLVYIDFLP